MAGKIKTIHLDLHPYGNPNAREIDPRDKKAAWYVRQVTDSTAIHPGQMLLKGDVDALCASAEWKVTIKQMGRGS